jgi:hypothetical protein
MMATTMRQQPQKNHREPTLLLALDLGLKTWKLGFARDFQDTPWLRRLRGEIRTSYSWRSPRPSGTSGCVRIRPNKEFEKLSGAPLKKRCQISLHFG